MYSFGDGANGQLGHGTTVLQCSVPRRIEALKDIKIVHISCGENHSAVISGMQNPCVQYFCNSGKISYGFYLNVGLTCSKINE